MNHLPDIFRGGKHQVEIVHKAGGSSFCFQAFFPDHLSNSFYNSVNMLDPKPYWTVFTIIMRKTKAGQLEMQYINFDDPSGRVSPKIRSAIAIIPASS